MRGGGIRRGSEAWNVASIYTLGAAVLILARSSWRRRSFLVVSVSHSKMPLSNEFINVDNRRLIKYLQSENERSITIHDQTPSMR